MAAVGDVMLDRTLGDVVASGDIGFPFAFVADLLQRADFTVANLESALGDGGEPAAKSYTFRAPPEAAQAVAQAGIDLVSLANNHALDFGPQALLQGMALLEQEGISVVGAGEDLERAHRPHLVTLNGMSFAFLAYVNVPVEGRAPYFDTASWTAGPQTPGMAWARPDLITADVSDIRKSVDHVVVILHSGYEYVEAPSPEQVAASRAAIDAGATLVIGHHAHILQGVEFRGEGAIVYGLGNFAFNIDGSPETAILNAWFDKRGLRQIRYLPAIINPAGQPQPLPGDEAALIRSRIYSLSTYLN
jgi:poly-gamma-glutamate synthesis protein (capsule biosynthesis protein)